MKELNLSYIKDNYLTLDDLARQTGLDTQVILKMIEEGLVPEASYTIKEHIEIISPLGDQAIYSTSIDYFPASTIQLILQNKKQTSQGNFKHTFKTNFRSLLEHHPDKEFAYGNIFDGEGRLLEPEFEKVFEEEWQAYIAGIYGICTNNAIEEEIVKKEIAVKKLIGFNNKYGGRALNEQEIAALKSLKVEFDSVANLFAPYQRATSSRGKYLDKALKANGLADLIKQYDS